MSDDAKPEGEVPWPNQIPPRDGVVQVSQDPDLFADDPEDDPTDELKGDSDGDR